MHVIPGPIAESLDALAAWRVALERSIAQLGRSLAEQDLIDDGDTAQIVALRERLSSDKLVLAFVAEYSRGKSELINAIFFADAGRRVLPATPGRTTMCPVELRHEPGVPARLSLLPIETRRRGMALADLRTRDDQWQHVPLDPRQPQTLAQALNAVTRVQRVSQAEAKALGLWDESQPEDNPPTGDDGQVEVPAWRHAIINYPHPLLERGLVVIDTPGLNAVGAEPELTLSLLPSAHAVVFVLAADTGVTRSDLAVWRQYLGSADMDRFVVLNKIDALADPLLGEAEVRAQIEQQRQQAAQLLGMPPARVFALSARQALAARVEGLQADLEASRLLPLERALAEELLPRRRDMLIRSSVAVVERVRLGAARRLADRRRQQAEQLMELRGLRGKSSTKMRMLIERVDLELTEFERCTTHLAALRAVQMKLLKPAMERLASDGLRSELQAMQSAMTARPFNLGARSAFETLMARLAALIDGAVKHVEELRDMLDGSFRQLNTEFGFAFSLTPMPDLKSARNELAMLEKGYSQYLGLAQSWRMANPDFLTQFRRMLLSKVRAVFESAASEVEQWSKAATAQVELQLRERRRAFSRRREALQRVQQASGELEQRIAEVQSNDEHLAELQARLDAMSEEALANARRPLPELRSPAALSATAQDAA